VEPIEEGKPSEVADAVETQVPLVRAGGGIVWRMGPSGEPQVVVVHRPRYGDWSLPKGKRDPGETDEECALREVAEETGFRCTLGPELASSAYVDRKGRPKEVRWWVMTIVGGSFAATEEVDEMRWATVTEARWLLSYDRDREILDSFIAGT
jgi:8-oxo-dGTP pyrophosphatase MutT (NUDIX family)